MHDSSDTLARLRRYAASFERGASARAGVGVTFGTPAIDERLGGGIARGHLHEIFTVTADDAASAAGFALMLAIRAADDGGAILWVRQQQGTMDRGLLHAPGLAELGIDPARVIVVVAPDTKMLLRASADAMRCAALGAVVMEPWRSPQMIDLTVSRRFVLALEKSGVTAFLVRAGDTPTPSAANSRWEIESAPAGVWAANVPGAPSFIVRLLRRRGGQGGLAWRLEWDRDRHIFREAPLSGAVLPLSVGGSGPWHDNVGHLGQTA